MPTSMIWWRCARSASTARRSSPWRATTGTRWAPVTRARCTPCSTTRWSPPSSSPGCPSARCPEAALERRALGGLLATNRAWQPEMVGSLGLLECQAGPRCRRVVRALRRVQAPRRRAAVLRGARGRRPASRQGMDRPRDRAARRTPPGVGTADRARRPLAGRGESTVLRDGRRPPRASPPCRPRDHRPPDRLRAVVHVRAFARRLRRLRAAATPVDDRAEPVRGRVLLSDGDPGPILELHCGAGHIGQATAAWSGRTIVQIDDDLAACEWARRNAAANGVDADVRHTAIESLPADAAYALVLADPPYVPTDDVHRFDDDPRHAIDGGPDGLDGLRACLPVAAGAVRPGRRGGAAGAGSGAGGGGPRAGARVRARPRPARGPACSPTIGPSSCSPGAPEPAVPAHAGGAGRTVVSSRPPRRETVGGPRGRNGHAEHCGRANRDTDTGDGSRGEAAGPAGPARPLLPGHRRRRHLHRRGAHRRRHRPPGEGAHHPRRPRTGRARRLPAGRHARRHDARGAAAAGRTLRARHDGRHQRARRTTRSAASDCSPRRASRTRSPSPRAGRSSTGCG